MDAPPVLSDGAGGIGVQGRIGAAAGSLTRPGGPAGTFAAITAGRPGRDPRRSVDGASESGVGTVRVMRLDAQPVIGQRRDHTAVADAVAMVVLEHSFEL